MTIEWITIHEASRILNIPLKDMIRYCQQDKICKTKRAPDLDTLREIIWCYLPDVIKYQKYVRTGRVRAQWAASKKKSRAISNTAPNAVPPIET